MTSLFLTNPAHWKFFYGFIGAKQNISNNQNQKERKTEEGKKPLALHLNLPICYILILYYKHPLLHPHFLLSLISPTSPCLNNSISHNTGNTMTNLSISAEDSTLHFPRILCLHGGGTNARIFRMQCRVLERSLSRSFRLVYAEGLFPAQPGSDVIYVYKNIWSIQSLATDET